jgi:hypothetical protein
MQLIAALDLGSPGFKANPYSWHYSSDYSIKDDHEP